MNTVEPTVAPTASRWEDYIDIFFSPAELYRRRAYDRIGPPLWTLLLLAVVLYYGFINVNETIVRASMVDAQAQMAEAGQDPAALDTFVTISTYAGGIFAAAGYVISIALAAAFLWIAARFVDLKATFRQTFLIATYAGFIYLLANLAASILAMVAGEGLDPLRDMSLGLMRFFDPESLPKVVPALLRRTEIFFIWQAIVWAVGVRVVLGASKAQAAITAAAAWLLFAVPGVIAAALNFGPGAR